MNTARTFQLTIYFNVYDADLFAQAARERAISEGMTAEEAEDTYTADTLRNCAQMLFDPGMSPGGSEILDCTCE